MKNILMALAAALVAVSASPAFAQHGPAVVDNPETDAAIAAAKERAAAAAAEDGGYEITIWDHVFTQAQADAGKALYSANCQSCHGPTGRGGPGGPGVTGVALNKKWSDTTVLDLYTFAHSAMPPGKAGSIGNEQDYVNIVAHILELHGAEPGETEMLYDEEKLGEIYIVKKPKD